MGVVKVLIGKIDIAGLLKAFRKFEKFHQEPIITDRDKAGVIQSFEYTFELCWKTMKRILEEEGRGADSPKSVFRIAATNRLIDDPEIWFEFLKKRNITVHTYDEDDADLVLSICTDFSTEVRKFLKNIGVPDDQY